MARSWKARLLYGCALWAADIVHHNLVAGVSNTPEGMLIYHGSAAATDFLLLVCAAHHLKGRLSTDMQMLCWFSMVANFCGWLLYLAYAPPLTYDIAIKVLGYGQFLRLILAVNDADPVGLHLVRGRSFIGAQLHYREANK